MMQVLPHLLEEVRSEQLQQLVLPLVIHILGKQDKQVIQSVQHASQLMVSTNCITVSAHSQMQLLLQAGAQSLVKRTWGLSGSLLPDKKAICLIGWIARTAATEAFSGTSAVSRTICSVIVAR